MGIDAIDIAARGLGVFYAVGGLMAARAMASDLVMDRMLAALEGRRIRVADRVRSLALSVGSLLTTLAGLALAVMSEASLALFTANAAVQAVWLLFARAAFPPADADEAKGRRASINAFVGWLAATVFVAWLWGAGRLADLMAPGPTLVLAAGTLALAAYGAQIFGEAARRLRPPPSDGDAEAESEPPPVPPPSRIRLAPEVGCWPLWDAETDRNLAPEALGLPDDLVARIRALEDTFLAVATHEDPSVPVFADEAAARAYDAEGRAIADELALMFGRGNALWPSLHWAEAGDGARPLRVL